ncbi:MAG TPA: type VI secretion system protein TssA [Desulfomonilia bacterium]|nr:type VI secretion system protein TssA [Desulfomonilia bacterium]
MGKIQLDMAAFLAPIPGDDPAGEDLRYTDVYERIKEARRADDMLNQGDWQREVKRSDWTTVVEVALEALSTRTKDIQIAVWLTEGLIKKHGFAGLNAGLTIIETFVREYWDHVYPRAEDGDLEYRSGPLEFLNDKVALSIREIPMTDDKASEGYSWNRWQESRQVGYEKDTKNQWGDADEHKTRMRQERMAEGKIPAETFDEAVGKTSKDFYLNLADDLDACMETFNRFDAVVDEKFGRDAPRLSELKKAIEECQRLSGTIVKDKGGRVIPAQSAKPEPANQAEPARPKKGKAPKTAQEDRMESEPVQTASAEARQFVAPSAQFTDQAAFEDAVWQTAQDTLTDSGINPALTQLLSASGSAPSARQKNRYRLMMARLALMAQRPDIARPIVEELYALIGEIHLEKWESPLWIAEVIEAYYQCLTAEGASDEDRTKAENELFPKLCSLDITKALAYKKGG